MITKNLVYLTLTVHKLSYKTFILSCYELTLVYAFILPSLMSLEYLSKRWLISCWLWFFEVGKSEKGR